MGAAAQAASAPMSKGGGGPSAQLTYWSATAAAGNVGGVAVRRPRARHSAISLSSVI